MAKFKCKYKGCDREFDAEKGLKQHFTWIHKKRNVKKPNVKKRKATTKKKRGGRGLGRGGSAYATMTIEELSAIYEAVWQELDNRRQAIGELDL